MKWNVSSIAYDLVAVQPMRKPTIGLFYIGYETEEEKAIRENKIRKAKLDAIINDTEFIWLDEYNEPSF